MVFYTGLAHAEGVFTASPKGVKHMISEFYRLFVHSVMVSTAPCCILLWFPQISAPVYSTRTCQCVVATGCRSRKVGECFHLDANRAEQWCQHGSGMAGTVLILGEGGLVSSMVQLWFQHGSSMV